MNFLDPSPRRRSGCKRPRCERSGREHARRRLASVGAALLAAFAAGCASPGPPHPPTLNLPQIVKDLAADRVGDQVNLHWTTPSKTTDNLDIKGPITAEICRLVPSGPSSSPTPPASSHAPTCTPVQRISVQPGPSQATETLPRPLTLDPVALLTYRVQLFNRRGHSAGLSPEAFAAGGAAPPPVENLRATTIRTGAMLEWQPQTTSASVELDRFLDGAAVPTKKTAQPKPATKPLTKTRTKTKPKPASKTTPPTPAPTAKPPFQGTPAAPAEVKLRASGQPSDAGGTIDRTAESGQTYHYTAQRVRSVTLDGPTPATTHKLELRSTVSPPITVLLRDTFPPSAPTGLAAIPGGTTPADRSIDLSWEPNTDSDLAGYIVYRQQISPTGALTGPSTRLNSTPVPGPAFRDQTAASGQRYAYRVTAIDTAGNESAPSADVQETLREQ
jgi:hypothetical protein